MASQPSSFAPLSFSISSPFQAVRFIEVPEEVLEAITTSTSEPSSTPAPSRLKFKSARTSTTAGPSGSTQSQKDGILHLCTDTRAWAVKQVSTSNSVYLIRPSEPRSLMVDGGGENDDDGDGDGDGDGGGGGDVSMTDLNTQPEVASHGAVTAIAQVGNFLELHAVKIDEGDVERMIVEMIPVFHPARDEEDIDLDFLAGNGSKRGVGLNSVVDDVAVPDGVVKIVCKKLGVVDFQHGSGEVAKCMIPSTRALLEVWTEIVRSCAIESVALDDEINMVKILNLLDDTVHEEIVEALLQPDGVFDQAGLFEDTERRLKPEQTCRFIAGLVLSSAQDVPMSVDRFTNRWTDLLPASFVKYCTLEALTSTESSLFEVRDRMDEGSRICWTGPVVTRGVALVTALSAAPSSTRTAGDGIGKVAGPSSAAQDNKRKWHEKFGAQRNTKR